MLGNDKKENSGESSVESINKQDLTRLLIDYLNNFFPVYQEIKDKAWTRENELDELLPNAKQNHSIRKLLTDPSTVRADQKGIIVFRGEREGDGKKFYLYKLIETCYEAIPHFVWSDIDKMEKEGKLFRFPILVDKTSVECWLTSEEESAKDIVALTAQCFITRLKLETDSQRFAARKLAEELLQKGMLTLFVTEDAYYAPIKLIQKLISLMPDEGPMPILIYLMDNSSYPEIREGENEQFYCIDIKPLTDYQIFRYIAVELPDGPEIISNIKQHTEIIRLLSKQERLLKQIAIWKKNDINTKKDFKFDILQIEQDFIKEIIGDDEHLYEQLYEAAKLEMENKEIPRETLEALRETDFFKNGQFNYAESKYCLVAKEYAGTIDRLRDKDLEKTIEELIKKWPSEVQLYFAAFYMRDGRPKKNPQKRFDKYFKALCSVLNNQDLRKNVTLSPALILVDTLFFLGKTEKNLDDFVNWAVEELEKPDYDKKVFEALSHIKDTVPDSQIEAILCRKYTEMANPDVKRRIVYYYSYAHCCLPDDIVNDLKPEKKADIHLKYHIISALIDTVNISGLEEIRPIRDADYMRWVGMDNDLILQSELEAFYFLKLNKLYKSDGEYLKKRIDQLLEELVQGDDWKKAHILGALNRIPGLKKDDINYAITHLSHFLVEEVNNLSNPERIENNCLQKIRYIVEACCTLAAHKEADRKTTYTSLQEKLAEPIKKHGKEYMDPKVSFSTYTMAHSVFLMLICGLAFLKNNNLSIHDLLTGELPIERNLDVFVQDCEIDSTIELWDEDSADELEEIIQGWGHQPVIYSNPIVDAKYDSSVGRIYIQEEYAGMGFLFREKYRSEYRVYCITCAHLFAEQQQYLDNAKFEPLRMEENSQRYAMRPLYPKKDVLVQKKGLGASAEADVSIWAIDDIPYNVFLEIYDETDWNNNVLEKDSLLKAYGFPKASDFGNEHGRSLEYVYQDSLKDGFCNLIEKDKMQEKGSTIAYGYSGAPIINSEGRICAMHKGSEVKSGFFAISAYIIKELLSRKEWEQYE